MLDAACMKNGGMTDSDIVTDRERTGIMRNVECCIILHAGPASYADRAYIAPDDRIEPDTGVLTDFHITDHPRTIGKKHRFVKSGIYPPIGKNCRHGL